MLTYTNLFTDLRRLREPFAPSTAKAPITVLSPIKPFTPLPTVIQVVTTRSGPGLVAPPVPTEATIPRTFEEYRQLRNDDAASTPGPIEVYNRPVAGQQPASIIDPDSGNFAGHQTDRTSTSVETPTDSGNFVMIALIAVFGFLALRHATR